MTTGDPRMWHAVARAVRQRREAMGLRQSDLERRGGPSAGTVRNVEQVARPTYARRTIRQLEEALAWPPTLLNSVLASEDARVGAYTVNVTDETVADIINRNTGLTAHPGDTVQLGEVDARDRVLRLLGQMEPPATHNRTVTDDAGTMDRVIGKFATQDEAVRAAETMGSSVRQPTARSLRRREVDADGSVWEYRRALGRDADRVGTLPEQFMPLVAAAKVLDELDLAQWMTQAEAEGTEPPTELVEARDRLMVALSYLAANLEDLSTHAS